MKTNPLNLIAHCPEREYASLQYADKKKIDAVQFQLLKSHLHYAESNSPYYRRCFKDAGITPDDITRLENLSFLPFTEKEALTHSILRCEDDCNDFLAAAPHDIADICLTSATTGPMPTVMPQTARDLARLGYNEELAFQMAGIDASDKVMICAALDRCFMAGLAYFLGSMKTGSTAIRAGSSNAAHLWELSKLTRPTVIIGVPSLMHRIAAYALENGEDPATSGINKLVAIGEPTRGEDLELLPMASRLETVWDARIYSTYASTELATTFCECGTRRGGHLRPEMNVIEIVDEAGRSVADGTPGEVITTPLGVTGMPLIRFRTNDISYIIDTPCPCGRRTKRLAPVLGRKNQMLKYKGTTVFPNAVINALEGDPRFHTGYVEALKNDDGTDRIRLFASLTGDPVDDASAIAWMKERLRARIRVAPEIALISCKEADKVVYQFDKKRKRIIFIDNRD